MLPVQSLAIVICDVSVATRETEKYMSPLRLFSDGFTAHFGEVTNYYVVLLNYAVK